VCDEVFDPLHQFRKNCEDVWDAIVDIDDELRRNRGQTLASQEQDAQHRQA
jgi:tRNA G37 N-methylase Trm5